MLFFGLNSVSFNPLPISAQIEHFDLEKVDAERTPEKVLSALVTKLPLNWKGEEYKNIYIPCIPAIQFGYKYSQVKLDCAQDGTSSKNYSD